MIKIAIDCRLIGQSGIGTYIENIVHYAVNRNDVQFTLIGNSTSLEQYTDRGNCRIVECDYRPCSWKELFCCPTTEVNQCNAFYTPNFNIPMGIRVPVFSTIHDVVFFDIKGLCSPIGKVIRYVFMRRALNLSATTFTVSQFSESRIRDIFRPKCPIVFAYNGISHNLIEYKEAHAQDQIIPDDNFVFLGNLKKHKGITTLLNAFHLAKQQGLDNTKLIIIGNIDFRTKDDEAIRLLHEAGEDIVCIRNATNEEVYRLMASARAFISPSLYEGFGLPPLEAMYLGTPAIISDIPVYKEVYTESPATFFQTGNAADLAVKMQQAKNDRVEICATVSEKYNYKSVSDIIMTTIANYVNSTTP